MKAGYRGAFALDWAQTEIDGIVGAGVGAIEIGAKWRWWGEPRRLDGPGGVLVLDGGAEAGRIRRRAARAAARLIGRSRPAPVRDADPGGPGGGDEAGAGLTQSFTVTDGRAGYTLSVVGGPDGPGRPLLFAAAPLPPRDRDLDVIDCTLRPARAAPGPGAGCGMICFAGGTLIDTPQGARPIEAIRPGDLIETLDDGPQEVLWTGSRFISGARLFAMPQMRPLRIRAGALGGGRPAPDLFVSPDHRMLLRGERARALFGEAEMLVAARDLVDDRQVTVAHGLRELTYHHLMTARHQIIRANGLETESFQPASADPALLAPAELAGLAAALGAAGADARPAAALAALPGGDARRSLSAADMALLRFAAA